MSLFPAKEPDKGRVVKRAARTVRLPPALLDDYTKMGQEDNRSRNNMIEKVLSAGRDAWKAKKKNAAKRS